MKLYVFIKDPPGHTAKKGEYYDKAAKQIMSEIFKMKPYVEVSRTAASNVIFVDNRWKGSQIPGNIQCIRNLQNFAGYVIDYDPLKELEKATNDHDFVKSYSLGCTLFEAYGIKILKKFFDKNDVHITEDKFSRLNLQSVIIMLYTHKLIAKLDYDDITRITKIRNTLIIHADLTELDVKALAETSEYFDKILSSSKKLKHVYSSL